MQQQKASWLNVIKTKMGFGGSHVAELDRSGFGYADTLTTASLMGSGVIEARPRQAIHLKYQQMMAGPVISGALRTHVTAALGGYETSGNVMFIESTVAARGNARQEKLVSEIGLELGPLLNKIAMSVAYNGVGYGDAYVRPHTKKGKGVTDISVDEMMPPPLSVIPPRIEADDRSSSRYQSIPRLICLPMARLGIGPSQSLIC